MDDYKKEPGGKQKLQERNPKWINDDYVKFMRFAQYFIEKNGEGVMAFINPHGFLDNPTFRGMRWNLLSTYDEIYTIDLHGNAKKKETAPDGSKDENIFDIEQGVSINILVKNGSKITRPGDLGQIYHYDLYGKRKDKYTFLENTAFKDVPYQAIPNVAPMYFMVPKNFGLQSEYDKFFPLNNLFPINGNGMTTAHDNFVIDQNAQSLIKKFNNFKLSEPLEDELHKEFDVKKKNGWNILEGWRNLQNVDVKSLIKPLAYRPFDNQYIIYEDKLVWRTVRKVMMHYAGQNLNIGLLSTKACRDKIYAHAFVTTNISEAIFLSGTTGSNAMNFPLYLYPKEGGERIPNLNPDEIKAFEAALNLPFAAENPEKSFVPSCHLNGHPERSEGSPTDKASAQEILRVAQNDNMPGFFTPIDMLDYIYALLHSPTYRDTYKEFLKTDFPRVPY
ncbi:type ISP restriction/modification enzyme, partial [Thiomicrospira sp.]|uniref:type ISP restriction/modification enzyme n=1 Tax=Thiomicrospira sp. TaxID=935 RepID=UPI0034238DFA